MTREQMFVTVALSKHLSRGRQTNLTDCSISVVYEETIARAVQQRCVPGDISVTVSEGLTTSRCWDRLLLAVGNINLPMFSNLRS